MAMKLQKLQKLRVPRQGAKVQSARLPPFNQTIIINNPNININYLNDGGQPLSSRGLDNWNLNNNLKEFSETRQVGFFKPRRHNDRNKSNSPYIIHKVRTQDIKNINKIYGVKNMKDTLAHFHKNQTIGHIKQEEKIEPNPPALLEKIIAKQDKTSTQKFYHHAKRNPKSQLQKNFETLPTTFLASHLPNPETLPRTFRKNRFQVAGENITALTERLPPSQEGSNVDADMVQKREECEEDEEQGVRVQPRAVVPRLVPFQMRKRAYNKTIESINKGLLSQTDSYFDRTYADPVPQSQIQRIFALYTVFVNTLAQPQHGRSVNERSSQRCFEEWPEYDFHFEEERKRRPKTPRRKKPYDVNE